MVSKAPWDVIVVGQGLAGTTLAWHLREAGRHVLLVDADEKVTSSKVAAGLITPITGQRLVLSRDYNACLSEAAAFYARVEKITGSAFFHERIALRLFQSQAERAVWAMRHTKPGHSDHVVEPQPDPLLPPDVADARHGGFAMRAAQLDVAAYLAASRDVLDCTVMSVDWRKDVTWSGKGVTLGPHHAKCIISCEGYAATRNPYFKNVPFIAAKGDILTVKFHAPLPAHSIHSGIWLAPTAEPDIFRVGSTYDWERLDTVADPAARKEIEEKLQAFIQVPYTVLDHQAAVRPIISESKPVIGLHPEQVRLGFFNGLGSKGALLAPYYARQLTELLIHEKPPPREADLHNHMAVQ